MATEILKNGIHRTKMLTYKGKHTIQPVLYFMPRHDFSKDIRYADLCEPLTYREIEVAKRYSYGQITGLDAMREVCPKLSEKSFGTAFNRMSCKPEFKELWIYLKKLAFEYQFQGDMDDDKLLSLLEESINAMKPGAQKFNAAYKLYTQRQRDKKRAAGEDTDLPNPEGEEKWEASLADFDAISMEDDDEV